MEWSIIQKVPNTALDGLAYNDDRVKEYIRQEGGLRCVYCAIHENSLGGIQVFHVEHYRPKKKFPALERSLSNLYYACPICNRFKSDDWPADPDEHFGCSSYPDPSVVNYASLFQVEESGVVRGLFVASKYIVERLYFNRPQLILERIKVTLDKEMSDLNARGLELIEALRNSNDPRAISHLANLAALGIKINDLRLRLDTLAPYEISEVTRPSR